jgi:S-DNA-T family DNA segregation ATPase FtsK/SpoIIIE
MGAKLFTSRAAAGGPTIGASSAEIRPRSRSLGRLYEAAALLLFTGAAFLFLALATAKVDPLDASVHGANWVGPAGGNAAALLIQGFGLVAWLLPLEIALCGAPLFRGQRPYALGLRVAGDLLVAIVLSALVQVATPEAVVFGNSPAGGNVGLLFGELMREAFSTLGSFLVASTIVGLILIGRSSFSFIAGCQRALELARLLALRLEALIGRLSSAWGEARKLRGAARQAEREAALPRIETQADEAQILLALDDDNDWIPMDHTGTPPLAISEALREGRPVPIDGGRGLVVAKTARTPRSSRRLPARRLPRQR